MVALRCNERQGQAVGDFLEWNYQAIVCTGEFASFQGAGDGDADTARKQFLPVACWGLNFFDLGLKRRQLYIY